VWLVVDYEINLLWVGSVVQFYKKEWHVEGFKSHSSERSRFASPVFLQSARLILPPQRHCN